MYLPKVLHISYAGAQGGTHQGYPYTVQRYTHTVLPGVAAVVIFTVLSRIDCPPPPGWITSTART